MHIHVSYSELLVSPRAAAAGCEPTAQRLLLQPGGRQGPVCRCRETLLRYSCRTCHQRPQHQGNEHAQASTGSERTLANLVWTQCTACVVNDVRLCAEDCNMARELCRWAGSSGKDAAVADDMKFAHPEAHPAPRDQRTVSKRPPPPQQCLQKQLPSMSNKYSTCQHIHGCTHSHTLAP